MSRRLCLILIALLLIPVPVRGQDSEADRAQQTALIERVRAAVRATEDYPSGRVTSTTSSTDTMILAQGDTSYSADRQREREGVTLFTRGADGLPARETIQQVRVTRKVPNGTQSYTLSAELIVVGGALYVQATRESADPSDLPPLPQGWIAVTDAADWPALEDLGLADMLDDLDRVALFDRERDITLGHASAAALRQDTQDGQRVDVITLLWSPADLGRALAEVAAATGEAPALIAAYAALTPPCALTMIFTLGADDVIRSVETHIHLELRGLDLASFSPGAPPGATLTLIQTLHSTMQIAEVGAVDVTIATPDLGARTAG